MKVDDHAAIIWIWVGLLLGRMAEDGEIPGMASPTYGRLMEEAQSAQAGIRRVRVSVVVQTPFVYVHTLALRAHEQHLVRNQFWLLTRHEHCSSTRASHRQVLEARLES